MGSTREPPTYVPISIRLEPEQYRRFKEIATGAHRTMAGELRRLIDERIAEADADLKAAA